MKKLACLLLPLYYYFLELAMERTVISVHLFARRFFLFLFEHFCLSLF